MWSPLLIGNFGIWELMIILFIIILIFGAGKLPQLGAGMGEFIKNFKKSVKSDADELPADSEAPHKDA